MGYLPTLLSYSTSQIIADISYILYKSAVNNVKKNLSLVFPTALEEEIATITRQLFRNYSKYIVDYVRFTKLHKYKILEKIVYFDGKDNLEEAIQLDRGVIVLTAHLGNWELGGIFFGSYGLKTNVLTLPDPDPDIDEIRRWYRARYGVKTITIGDSPFSMLEIVKGLNNREVVAMLIDRYNDKMENFRIEFFNKESLFPRGPFILSRITGAPIVAAFVVRVREGYKGIVREPIVVSTEEEERKSAEQVVAIFQEIIEKYPDQWYNFEVH